jgi:hypothetical protein
VSVAGCQCGSRLLRHCRLLSRRDRLIVARHEVPGYSMQRPVPEGRLKSLSVPQIFVVETELMPLQKRQVLLSKSLVNPGR